ncbi:hypothetical protein PV326_011501 [Microctonus aethiopoides]|nr:hypothetical protein PV326_011501 [Microctonus aethiopoides]
MGKKSNKRYRNNEGSENTEIEMIKKGDVKENEEKLLRTNKGLEKNESDSENSDMIIDNIKEIADQNGKNRVQSTSEQMNEKAKVMSKANLCLDIDSSLPKDDQKVWFSIMERNKSRKGVISVWDMSLKKFSEALYQGSNIKSAEVMQKRVFSSETKNYIWKDTNNIVITVEGSVLPNKIKIYEGLTTIKIFPMDIVIETVAASTVVETTNPMTKDVVH